MVIYNKTFLDRLCQLIFEEKPARKLWIRLLGHAVQEAMMRLLGHAVQEATMR